MDRGIDKFYLIAKNKEQCQRWAKNKNINLVKVYMCDDVKEAENLKKEAEKFGQKGDIINIRSLDI
jgi:hypothetical protein